MMSSPMSISRLARAVFGDLSVMPRFVLSHARFKRILLGSARPAGGHTCRNSSTNARIVLFVVHGRCHGLAHSECPSSSLMLLAFLSYRRLEFKRGEARLGIDEILVCCRSLPG